MSDRTTQLQYGNTAITLGTLAQKLPHILTAIRERQTTGLRATNTQPSNRTPVLYCTTHERDLTDCRRNNHDCDGIPVDAPTDPTGDGATTNDRARTDEHRLHTIARLITNLTNEANDIAAIYTTTTTDPKAIDLLRREAARAQPCELHTRVGETVRHDIHLTDLSTKNRTQAAGFKLERPYRLCRWCRDYITDTHQIPTDRQLTDHSLGRRVMRPAS